MSRLDRLVVLLETGSTPFIRNTAADQLSDLAKAHPEDTINLLGRVYPYLKSKNGKREFLQPEHLAVLLIMLLYGTPIQKSK